MGFQMKTFSGAAAFYAANNTEYVNALKAAILSGQREAPSLVPVVIFTGPKSAEQTALESWLHRHGAVGITHNLSFQHDMDMLSQDQRWGFSQYLLGSWLRVDFPNVLQSISSFDSLASMTASFRKDFMGVDQEYVLWTDPDILFRGSIDSCTLAKPQVLSVGPEMRMGWPENYGVIYFNVSGYREVFPRLIDWGRKHRFHFDHDQNLFLAYWGTAVDVLPNGMNWKPYWGDASTAIPGTVAHEQVRIVHFHGPKLSTAICFFNHLDRSGKPDKVNLNVSVARILECGLPEFPKGDTGWPRLLSSLLTQAYERDKGRFYRELSQQVDMYLASSVS